MIIIPDELRRPAEVERDELKKQLAEALAEIKRLQEWEHCMKTQAPYEAAGATWEQRHKHDLEELQEARAEIERQSRIIERMRTALSGVIRVADRKTVEFDNARSCLND